MMSQWFAREEGGELVEGGKDEGGRVEKSPVKEKIESTANG